MAALRQEDVCVLLPLQSVQPGRVAQTVVVVGVTTDGFDEAAYHAVMDDAVAVMAARGPQCCFLWNLGWRME